MILKNEVNQVLKRVVFVLLVSVLCIAMTACDNNDAIIDRFEQAINEGDYDEAAEILYELDEERLTEKQQMRIAEIATNGATKSIMGTYLKYLHQGGSEVSDLISEMDEDFDILYDEDIYEEDENLD